jgi:hypothetical protein
MNAQPGALEISDIQGNILAGFNKDFASFLLFALPSDSAKAQGWVAAENPLARDFGTRTERREGMLLDDSCQCALAKCLVLCDASGRLRCMPTRAIRRRGGVTVEAQ